MDYKDITNTAGVAILTSLLEPTVGIIAACTPNMRHLFDTSLSDRWAYVGPKRNKSDLMERKYDYHFRYPDTTELEDGVTIGLILNRTISDKEMVSLPGIV